MSVLLIAEHNNKEVKPFTLNAISAASQINEDVHVLVLGSNSDTVAKSISECSNVKKVIHINNELYENYLAENYTSAIIKLSGSYSHIICSANTFGKNLMPRIAALLDVSQVSDITKVISEDTFIRPIYAGNAISYVQTEQKINLITVRPTSFEKCEESGGSAQIEEIPFIDTQVNTIFVNREVSKTDRPELGNARIVVSGGRGLENSENFKLLYDLADKLNAAVGASRAAVDSGYIGNEYQVGQTGKMVAPELYIAVGISGAIQHLAGMKERKVIVAINKDLEAPIFNVADYGLSSDLFQAIPEIIKELDLLNTINS